MTDQSRPLDALRAALRDISPEKPEDSPAIQLDYDRAQRTGIPEIVYAENKPTQLVIESLARLATTNGRALASRCSTATLEAVRVALGGTYTVVVHELARAVVVAQVGIAPPQTGGRVGIITAGSSDRPVAAEAALMAAEMGAEVSEVVDVGVAGLHRLLRPLEELLLAGVDVIVVVAGMDGALPSVVAGLAPVPVIGLPTSVGYGLGGGGIAALQAMLQSCAPGLVVVNIDNGIGAGATAALIANRVAQARDDARRSSS